MKTFRDTSNNNLKDKDFCHSSVSYTSINETKIKFNKNKNFQYNCLKEKLNRIQVGKSKEKLCENFQMEKSKDIKDNNINCTTQIPPMNNQYVNISDNKDNKEQKVFSVSQKNINGIKSSSVAEKLVRNQPTLKERLKIQLQLQENNNNKHKGNINSYQIIHKILKK